jgi:hypothetical protein
MKPELQQHQTSHQATRGSSGGPSGPAGALRKFITTTPTDSLERRLLLAMTELRRSTSRIDINRLRRRHNSHYGGGADVSVRDVVDVFAAWQRLGIGKVLSSRGPNTVYTFVFDKAFRNAAAAARDALGLTKEEAALSRTQAQELATRGGVTSRPRPAAPRRAYPGPPMPSAAPVPQPLTSAGAVVVYAYKLRPDHVVKIPLPSDIHPAELSELASFILSLA